MPNASEFKTLPQLSNQWCVGLDGLRQMVRESARLKSLGTKFGPTRVFNLREQAEIRAALDALRGVPVAT